MGSLPDLTELSRPHSIRNAARTVSDPHRHRTVIQQVDNHRTYCVTRFSSILIYYTFQLPANTIHRKEWLWRKTRTPVKLPATLPRGRRDSAASSVGAASIRRLITRQPPKLPKPLIRRFTLLCIASGLCSTALLPFTAFAGAEAGSVPLAIMHMVAAIVAPFSPLILQKTGTRIVVTVAHILICILLIAHTIATPLAILLPLYAICGFSLSPMSLALSASATSLAQTAGDEIKRKIALRRALRALRAAQDLGLVCGSLMLGGALVIWPETHSQEMQLNNTDPNMTLQSFPSAEEYYSDEDYEVSITLPLSLAVNIMTVRNNQRDNSRKPLVVLLAVLVCSSS